jgi:hypothetical protein
MFPLSIVTSNVSTRVRVWIAEGAVPLVENKFSIMCDKMTARKDFGYPPTMNWLAMQVNHRVVGIAKFDQIWQARVEVGAPES